MPVGIRLENWQWTAVALCGFGLFKEIRVSEPFFTQYVLEYKNITRDQLVHDVYPVWTYSYLATLAVVFLVTDFLRYRAVIILEGAAFVCCFILLIWAPGLASLLVVEFLYGLGCSTEIAYYTYAYAKVDRSKYKKVTSYTHGALLIGKFLAGTLSQTLISFKLMNYLQLNYVTLGCMTIALLFSLTLPPVGRSIYFYRGDGDDDGRNLTFSARVRKAYPVLWQDFVSASRNSYAVRWSIWWIFATAGYLQVLNYIQPMWETIASYDKHSIYNGAVEAVHTLTSAVLVFGVGYVKLPLVRYGDWFLALSSVTSGLFLLVISRTGNIVVAYVTFVLFRITFRITSTVASAEVAQSIREDSHGLIFGVNTFAALVLQTLLTLAVTDRRGLELSEPTQFMVYSCCYIALALFYLLLALYRSACKGIHRSGSIHDIVGEENEESKRLNSAAGENVCNESPSAHMRANEIGRAV